MRTYKKHIVAFLDILGFKNMINTKAFDDIRDIFRSIIPQEDLSFALGRAADDSDYDLICYNRVMDKAKIRIMSDSIVIAVPSGRPEALAVVIDICCAVQEALYDLNPPVFLRGAVAEGDFYLDENLIFGKALVDAYLAQENYAIYPRIIIADNVISEKQISVVEMLTLPRDEDGYCYINTLERYFGFGILDSSISCEKFIRIKKCIDTELSGYTDRRIREKYIWLNKELRRIEESLL